LERGEFEECDEENDRKWMIQRTAFRQALLERASSADELDDQHDNRDNEQNMDESARNVERRESQ
jgi:hypothetical protein